MKERNKDGYRIYINDLRYTAKLHRQMADGFDNRADRLQRRLEMLDYYGTTEMGFMKRKI